MWNPDAYRDTDYGLDEDETFEPRDDTDAEYEPGPGDPFVTTVLGPIRPDEVGVALVREHLHWVPTSCSDDADSVLNRREAALQDLEAFFTVSGRTVVSATPAGAGRDARQLVWLAQRAPVHIVAATGYAGGVTEEDARATIERDLAEGLDGTAAQPGVVVVGDRDAQAGDAELAAVRAIVESGGPAALPVICTAPAARQRALADRLAASGVAPRRVIVANAADLTQEDQGGLLADGAWLLFDEIGERREHDQVRVRRIADLVADGHGGRLLISHAYRRRSHLGGYGGRPGMSYVVEEFAVMLLEAGLEALDVRRMLVDNAVAALATVAIASGTPETQWEGRL